MCQAHTRSHASQDAASSVCPHRLHDEVTDKIAFGSDVVVMDVEYATGSAIKQRRPAGAVAAVREVLLQVFGQRVERDRFRLTRLYHEGLSFPFAQEAPELDGEAFYFALSCVQDIQGQ